MEWKQWRNELLEWNSFAAEGWAPSHNPQLSSIKEKEQIKSNNAQFALFDWLLSFSFLKEREEEQGAASKRQINLSFVGRSSWRKRKTNQINLLCLFSLLAASAIRAKQSTNQMNSMALNWIHDWFVELLFARVLWWNNKLIDLTGWLRRRKVEWTGRQTYNLLLRN